MSLQTFNELHVVSDLHLGGMPGFQIFSQGDTLANFIKVLAQPSPKASRLGIEWRHRRLFSRSSGRLP